jgi:hypothetical protein
MARIARSWIACEGDADDPSFSISLEDRGLEVGGINPMKGHIKLFTLQLDLELAAKLDASRTANACADKARGLSAETVLSVLD